MNKRGTTAILLVVVLIGALGLFVMFRGASVSGMASRQTTWSPTLPEMPVGDYQRCVLNCDTAFRLCMQTADAGYSACIARGSWEQCVHPYEDAKLQCHLRQNDCQNACVGNRY